MNNTKYNPKIHQRRSIRLKGYDYSQAGLYFVTICCQEKAYLFGDIINTVMVLNDAGKIANRCWLEIPKHFPNAVLHEHIVMPNHIHGIVELLNNTHIGANNYSPDNHIGANNYSPDNHIGANNYSPLQSPSKTIGSIVRGFKIGVTKWMRQNTDVHDVWQRNYYEIIIRNEQAYHNISKYIIDNPMKWRDDTFNKQ